MRSLISSLIFILFSSNLFASIDFYRGSWLCIEDSGVGFNWNSNLSKWEPVGNFIPRKYIFKTFDDDSCYNAMEENQFCAELYDFGDAQIFERNFTYYPKSEYRDFSTISGPIFGGKFKMSEQGDFTYSYNIPGPVGPGGTLEDGTKNHKDSMKVSVGSCSKI